MLVFPWLVFDAVESQEENPTLNDTGPIITDDPLYCLLREGKIDEFNARRQAGAQTELRQCDFRGSDLRGMDANGLDLTDAYFRGADLRGLDLRETNMRGASLAQAHISGTYFSAELDAQELMMSVQYGTRLRY
jgi:uncharacterized protein YjbI with pentapeptide repeats